MKITDIRINNKVALITKSPNWLERCFGMGSKTLKYYKTGTKYKHFPEQERYINEEGEILDPIGQVARAIINKQRIIDFKNE